MNYLKFVFSQIKDDFTLIFLIIIEIIILIVSFNIFFSSYYDYLRENKMYSDLNFDKAVVYETEYDITPESIDIGASEYMGKSYEEIIAYCGETQYRLKALDKEYIMEYKLPFQLENSNDEYDIKGVFLKNNKDIFQIGNIYTMTYNDWDGRYFKVLMIGMINGNDIILPPSQGSPSGTFLKNQNYIYVFDETGKMNFDSRIGFCLSDDPTGTYRILNDNENVKEVYLAQDHRNFLNTIIRKEMGIPLILSFVILSICIASFSGYNLLNIMRKERMYGVFYMSGATWKECILIQLLKDLIVLFVPIILSFGILAVLDINRAGMTKLLTPIGILISSLICLLVFIVTSFIGILKLKKVSPIDIIRR